MEAIGFYLAYLLLGIILGGIIGGISGALFAKEDTFQAGFEIGSKVGVVVSVTYCLVISYMVLKNKNLLSNFLYLLLGLASGVLATFGGGLLGLLPTAFLTTRGSKTKKVG